MESLLEAARREESALVAKLSAVRALILAYGEAGVTDTVGDTAAAPRGATAPTRRVVRLDKFGAYGESIIKSALSMLPAENESPMPTRELVARFERYGVEVRGENKVNALSAMLARSSKIKGHGRAGWTIYGQRTLDPELEDILGSNAPNENEAPRESVRASDAPTTEVAASEWDDDDI